GVRARAVVPLAPDPGVVRDPDEPRRDPDDPLAIGSAAAPHGTLEDEVDVDLGPNLADRLPFRVVVDGGRPRDDGEPRQGGEPAGDLLGQAGGEHLVLTRAEALERKHREPGSP